MRATLIMVFLVSFLCVAHADAASISDINKKMFYKVTRPGTIQRESSPFAQGGTAPEDLVIEDLQLVGVIIGDNSAYALISGYVVEEGEIIAGYKVTSIDRDSAVLKRLDEVFVLNLGGGY